MVSILTEKIDSGNCKSVILKLFHPHTKILNCYLVSTKKLLRRHGLLNEKI